MAAEPIDLDAYRANLAQKQEMLSDTGVTLGGGRGGPHDPGMEQRVTTLETDMKEVKASLSRIETTLAVVAEGVKHLATKADLATLSGRADTLGTIVDKVERDVSAALTTAIGKAIGPAQFMTMIGTSVAIFMAGVAAYGWLTAQQWFHH